MSDSFVIPWTVACQSPQPMEFPRQEYCDGLPFPSLRGLPDPEIESTSPALAGGFSTTEPSGKPTLRLSLAQSQIAMGKCSGIVQRLKLISSVNILNVLQRQKYYCETGTKMYV